MNTKLYLSVGLVLLFAACSNAVQSGANAITIKDAWARPSPTMSGAGAAYFVIENTGATDDKLISVKSDVAMMTELHESKEVDGMMEMSPVDSIAVPANGQAELKPGSYHVMLMNLSHELKAGDQVKLTLTFEKAGTLEVMCEVKDQ